MDERRLTRKEGFEVWVPSLDANVKVDPLPWRARGDLGTLIASEFDKALKKMEETKGADLSMIYDYSPVLATGLPGIDLSQISFEELIPLCRFICEVNGLDTVLWMLDPEAFALNSQPTEERAEPEDGEKTSSTDDSSLLAFPQEKSMN